jgi:hypothetical protein
LVARALHFVPPVAQRALHAPLGRHPLVEVPDSVALELAPLQEGLATALKLTEPGKEAVVVLMRPGASSAAALPE